MRTNEYLTKIELFVLIQKIILFIPQEKGDGYMNERPKVGLFFMAGETWWEAGVNDAKEGTYAGFIKTIENDVAAIMKELAKHFDIVSSGLLHTKDAAVKEARKFNSEKVDAIVFCPIIWTNDPPVTAFIQEANKVPLMIWAYDPYKGFPEYFKIEVWLRASGPVSVQQSSNILKRHKWDYEVVFGNEKEEETIKELKSFISASTVKKSLVGTRIGVLPSPCRIVISSWVDEFYLLEKFGVELEYIPVDTFDSIAKDVKNDDAEDYVNYLKAKCTVDGVDDDTLLASAKQALAFVKLIEEKQLSGIALEDFNDDIYRILGFRPHLYHHRFGELGCTIGFEADVPGVLATIIASRLAGHVGMFNEFFSVDRYKNTIVMGHPGHGEISMGDPSTYMVTYDLEFDASQKRGAWLSYKAREGEMTFLNFTPEYGKLKAAVFTAESLPGPRVMEGYAHMLVKPPGDVIQLFKNIVGLGLMQHWGTVYGNIVDRLAYLMKLYELDLNIL
jgi:L-arabinose isomerase